MPVQIRRAERKQAKLRIGTSGPSGSGKTYSALLIARGLASSWDKIVLIDTENGSGELYSDLGAYNVITLTADFTPEKYIEAIKASEDSGAEVIIIDSVSHEWDGKGGLLEANERLASAKFKGNTWAAWSETTPRHQKFIDAIVSSKCHIITTARSKTDTIQTEDKKIKKVGLKEIQREGFEYELTANFNIDRDGHYAMASKDRTELFINRDPFVITQKTGEELAEWNSRGIDPAIEEAKQRAEAEKRRIEQLKREIIIRLRFLGKQIEAATIGDVVETLTRMHLVPENYAEIITRLEILCADKREADKEAAARPPAPVELPVVPPQLGAYAQDDDDTVKAPQNAPEAEILPNQVYTEQETTVEYDEGINPEDIPF